MVRNKTQASQSNKRQNTPSQPSTSRATNQSTIEEAFGKAQTSQLSTECFEEYIKKCVRYIVMKAGTNIPIRKTDLQKHTLQNAGKNFDKILKEVVRILDRTYGYKLQICEENTNTKSYVVTSTLPYIEEFYENTEEEIPNDAYKCLVMLVLTHIYMSDNTATEASLVSFLKTLHIDVEKEHSLFGNIKEHINGMMVKQKYLIITKDQNNKSTYSWGPKAEKTVSKHELLKFVCKIYKNREPKHWQIQFETAIEQFDNEENAQAEEN